MTLSLGDSVRVLEPFNETFSDVYFVTEIVVNDDQSESYVLGDLGAFDKKFLEKT